MGKIRLVGGPGGGKVVEHSGGDMIKYRGPTKMTRKKRMEYEIHRMETGVNAWGYGPPMSEAVYKIAVLRHVVEGRFTNIVCTHPDGSVFYKYVEGTRRDC